MSWVAVGVTAVSAVKGNMDRKAQEHANQANADANAAQMQFSPWTGAKPGAFQAAPVTSSALGGAAQGFMASQMYKGGGTANSAPTNVAGAGDGIAGGAGGPQLAPLDPNDPMAKYKNMFGSGTMKA